MASLIVLALLVLFVLAACPLRAALGIDPNATDLLVPLRAALRAHWLGTDDAGRDELLRLMLGGQISLLVGVLATLVGGVVGVAIGLLAGYFGGRLDAFLMRFTDGVIALPLLPLLIVLARARSDEARFLEPSSPIPARRLLAHRHHHLAGRLDRDRAPGARRDPLDPRARLRARRARQRRRRGPACRAHPAERRDADHRRRTLTIGRVILFESVLSFLGFGIVPPTPSWGNMLNNAQELVTTAPALAIYPGLLIFITVIAVNFLGDGLQHAFDPRSE